jgi:hypothetical protein
MEEPRWLKRARRRGVDLLRAARWKLHPDLNPLGLSRGEPRVAETRPHNHGRCPDGLSARIELPLLSVAAFFPSPNSCVRGIPLTLPRSCPAGTGPSAPLRAEGHFCPDVVAPDVVALVWAAAQSSGSDKGERLIWIASRVVNKLRATPRETYSALIIRRRIRASAGSHRKSATGFRATSAAMHGPAHRPSASDEAPVARWLTIGI